MQVLPEGCDAQVSLTHSHGSLGLPLNKMLCGWDHASVLAIQLLLFLAFARLTSVRNNGQTNGQDSCANHAMKISISTASRDDYCLLPLLLLLLLVFKFFCNLLLTFSFGLQ